MTSWKEGGRFLKRALSAPMLVAVRATRATERPSLSVAEHLVSHPRFPVIDVHRHLNGPFDGGWSKRSAAQLAQQLDRARIERIVDLDGGTGAALDAEVRKFRALEDRVAVLAGVDYELVAASDGFGLAMASELRRAHDIGAKGLKVWKTLGLHARDRSGRLVGLDDERLDPLWAMAAELALPVVIHVADPRAFFDPLTRSNERWEELRLHPEWHYQPTRPRGDTGHRGFPSHAELIEQFGTLLGRHPDTTFIGSHMAGCVEDLRLAASLLDDHPNLFVDVSARVAELGRQPYSAHDFIVRYADRVLFGTDHGDDRAYGAYYRLLETRDEYFEYEPGGPQLNGRWRIYGLGLPDDVLERVYHLNARRLIWPT